jgi:pyruvate dehydrogenase E2 component (dihydrolipoamide acetyltransferase)
MSEFRMPSLGADMTAGTLRAWIVKQGDHVQRGDIIAEVETQKGIIDIEVFESGIIGELLVHENEKVPTGTLLTSILPAEAKIVPAVTSLQRLRASPLARKIAAEGNIELGKITGTGPGGAITRHDAEDYIASIKKTETHELPAPEEKTEIRQAIAELMSKSQQEVPPYVVKTIVDMEPCLKHLSDLNSGKPERERILVIALIAKAVAVAAKEFTKLNGWWRGEFISSEEVTLGIVVSLRSGGIVVPVIKNADRLSLDQIMNRITDLILRSRAGHLKGSDIELPSITLTSLGDVGVESLTGIIYPPQVALIATGGVINRPWAVDHMLTVRPSIELSLSADHRATDGIYGSNFLSKVKTLLHEPSLL